MNKKLPKISIVIPVYNEQNNIRTCLNAILNQDYPKELIELIIVDNGSNDATVPIVKKYMNENKNIILTYNKIIKDAEVSKMIGLKKASGEFFMYLDADIEIVGRKWLINLIKPLMEDLNIIGSFPRFMPKPTDRAIGRYLRYHPLELDPVFQFFCTEIADTIVEDRGYYKLCEFNPPRVPPIGICLYRRKELITAIGHMDRFMDIDVPVILSKMGFRYFAYVPSCGIYHVNIQNFTDLIRKRLRNLEQTYLPNIDKRLFKYFDINKKKDIIKLMLWIIIANTFLPKLITGTYKAIKYKDYALLYEPFVSMILTDVLIYGFLKNKNGRKLILNILRRRKIR